MQYRAIALSLILLGTLLWGPCAQATVVVVASGINFNSCAPFGRCLDIDRYQQWYSRDQFATFLGPELITQIAFRADQRLTGPVSITFSPNVEIQLSTTTVLSLGTVFADNVGNDVMTDFAGPLTLSGSDTSFLPPFDFVILLQTPFLYDPNLGDLLFEFRNHSGTRHCPHSRSMR